MKPGDNLNSSMESRENTSQTKPRYREDILSQCKEAMERLNGSLEQEKNSNAYLQKKVQELSEELDARNGEAVELRDRNQNLRGMPGSVDDYQKEVEKVGQLQDMLCSFKEAALKGNTAEAKVAALKDKLNSANLTMNDLRNRIKTLEENSEKKDNLLREWNGTIEQFEVEMKKLIEENSNYVTERELIRSSLNHVTSTDSRS
jgi:chromosome segregation ATPase